MAKADYWCCDKCDRKLIYDGNDVTAAQTDDFVLLCGECASASTTMPSDETLADTYETAVLNKRLDFQWPYDESEEHAAHLAGIRAVREAITAERTPMPSEDANLLHRMAATIAAYRDNVTELIGAEDEATGEFICESEQHLHFEDRDVIDDLVGHGPSAITAERTPMPSDEAIDFGLRAVLEAYDYPQDVHVDNLVEDLIHEMRQVFPAAQPLTPEIPEGWVLHSIASVAGREVSGFSIVGYNAYLRRNPFSTDPQVSGYGPTWHEALAAAIAATGEGE